ncbi:ERBB-3 BINDING PROTEIN 1 [Diplonema papillatum]|nr:ERBB-3 BINDING PROTEIN 1 [Diplonema papillatum]
MADEEEATYSEEEEDNTLVNSAVVEKYKTAGSFCNVALKAILEQCKPGAKILELAEIGDKLILEQTEKVFNKGKGDDKIEKGMAFPTCVNVNSTVCHYSPESDDASPPLVAGDVVKIDLGCHIDGFCAVLAHTVIVADDLKAEVPASPASNVVAAAAACNKAVTHCMRPGVKNTDVTATIEKIAKDFNVTPVEGVLSHELKRYIIDGSSCIANKHTPDQRLLETEFNEASAWTLDVVFSSAPFDTKEAGKLRQEDAKTSVFKRSLDTSYQLKMKASREVFFDINKKFQTFPFSMRHLDPKKGRFCISECMKHDLVNPYPVLKSKADETVAQFKTTILLKPSEIEAITGVDAQKIATDKAIVDKDVLNDCGRSLQLKKKKKKNKKKSGAKDDKKDEE